MALGLTLLGLLLAALVACAGQLWMAHQTLQDAVINAVVVLDTSQRPTSDQLAALVMQNGQYNQVTVSQFTSSAGKIAAEVRVPVTLWFWSSWMGATPVSVMAGASAQG